MITHLAMAVTRAGAFSFRYNYSINGRQVTDQGEGETQSPRKGCRDIWCLG